nr:uncharacterized protein LOC113711701 [Coffea arabica]
MPQVSTTRKQSSLKMTNIDGFKTYQHEPARKLVRVVGFMRSGSLQTDFDACLPLDRVNECSGFLIMIFLTIPHEMLSSDVKRFYSFLRTSKSWNPVVADKAEWVDLLILPSCFYVV